MNVKNFKVRKKVLEEENLTVQFHGLLHCTYIPLPAKHITGKLYLCPQ